MLVHGTNINSSVRFEHYRAVPKRYKHYIICGHIFQWLLTKKQKALKKVTNGKSTERRCDMKLFYKRIRVDAETLRFYAECPICGKKQYGAKIPLICRSVRTLARCANGRANKLSQSAFNHAKVKATQQLALRFNQCRHCFQCVCDDCYDSTDAFGACRDCFHKNER